MHYKHKKRGESGGGERKESSLTISFKTVLAVTYDTLEYPITPWLSDPSLDDVEKLNLLRSLQREEGHVEL